MLTNGFFARLNIIDVGKRGKGQNPGSARELPNEILDIAKWWADFIPGDGNFLKLHPKPALVPFTADATDAIDKLRRMTEDEYDIADEAGPNGAGKTTFASRYLPQFAGCQEFVNADLIAAGLSPFNPESQSAIAGRLMLKRIEELTAAQFSFGFETTLAGRAYSKRLQLMKSNFGYRVSMFFIWLPSVDQAIKMASGESTTMYVLLTSNNFPRSYCHDS